jgi:hypothetical protein
MNKATYTLSGNDAQALFVDRVAPPNDLIEHACDSNLFFGWPASSVYELMTRQDERNGRTDSPAWLILGRRHWAQLGVDGDNTLVRPLWRRLDHRRVDLCEHSACLLINTVQETYL